MRLMGIQNGLSNVMISTFDESLMLVSILNNPCHAVEPQIKHCFRRCSKLEMAYDRLVEFVSSSKTPISD